jgi:hypothetical protein
MDACRATRRHSRGRRLRLDLLLLIGLLSSHALLADTARAAQTWYVAPDGRDSNSCRTTTAPCRTIERAIQRAASGDTIMVAAGRYNETLRIEKSLRLLGAQANTPAVGRSGAESIIDPARETRSGVIIRADGVTLDGFTIGNSTKRPSSAAQRYGVDLDSTFGKPWRAIAIRNTAITRYTRAISITAANEVTLAGNLLQGMDYGVYVAGGSTAITISNNTFPPHDSAAISFVAGTHRNVQIDQNTFQAASIELADTIAATITNNASTNAVQPALLLSGGNQDVLISGNVLMTGASSAVQLQLGPGDAANRDVRLTRNTLTQNATGLQIEPGALAGALELHFNRIAGNASAGVANNAAVAINAENNWWGCSAGPGQTGCNTASGPVDVTPWLVLRARFAPLLRTGVQTPISADLTFNSDGVSTAAAGALPDRTPISFGGTLGAFNPPIVGTSNGVATALYTAGATAGSARLTVTADYQALAQDVPVRVGRFLPLLLR